MLDDDDILASMRKPPAPNETWRAVVIADQSNIKYFNGTVQRIRQLGIENINVFCPGALTVPQRYDFMLHRDHKVRRSLDVWKMALSTCGLTYTQSSAYFLIVEPGVYFWEQLPVYCESVIPQNELAVWCPATPASLWPDRPMSKPNCPEAFGWCPELVDASIEYQHCFILTGHMMTLLAAYLEPIKTGHVGSVLACELGKRHVPYYFHTPAICSACEATKTSSNFIGVAYDKLAQSDMRQNNFKLPNNRARSRRGRATFMES